MKSSVELFFFPFAITLVFMNSNIYHSLIVNGIWNGLNIWNVFKDQLQRKRLKKSNCLKQTNKDNTKPFKFNWSLLRKLINDNSSFFPTMTRSSVSVTILFIANSSWGRREYKEQLHNPGNCIIKANIIVWSLKKSI